MRTLSSKLCCAPANLMRRNALVGYMYRYQSVNVKRMTCQSSCPRWAGYRRVLTFTAGVVMSFCLSADRGGKGAAA